VTADAVEGRDSELRRRLQTGTVPVLVLTELACQPRADTIIGLLDDDRLGHLASLLDRGPHIRTNGQLAAAWIQRTTTEQLVIALGAFRPAEHDTWLISTLVLDALARKLADEPILATRIAEWAADHTATLYASPSGARLAHDVLQLLPVSDVSAKATALRDAAALHAPNVSDEALEQYPPLPGPSTELLRRRGIQDPSAWRFVLTATSFPGPAGDLVAMAEMVVGQHGQPG
jgi:hypothetical protein